MADFYPLLSRAVSKLPVNGPHERQELYDKARAILLEQLHGTATASSLMRQQASLEAAIRRIEAEIRVDIVRRGPLSRAINFTAQENITSQNGGRPAASEPFTTKSSKRPREDQTLPPFKPDFRPRFDVGISRHDQEPHEPEGKHGSVLGTEHYAVLAAVCDAPANGYEEGLTLPTRRGETKPTFRTNAKFHIDAQFSQPVSIREEHRSSWKRPETQNVKPSKPLLRRLSVIIALTAGMALIVISSAVIVFPLLALHASRLVWLSQHLFDNPVALRSFLIVTALVLLLSFPLFHLGRKKLRRALARR
jgi:hypothetical protein